MNKFIARSLTVAAALAFGTTVAGAARAEAPAAEPVPITDQARLASATLRLEKAFADPFARGEVSREALADKIGAVIDASPESARADVGQHIERVVETGQKLSTEMSPADREKLAAAPKEDVGSTEQGLISTWGWPSTIGFGGLGAFGFPGMYYGNIGYGAGYGLGTTYGLYGVGLGTGYGVGYGTGNGIGYGLGTGYGVGSVRYGFW
jgi:hypothetical protein